MNGKRSFGQPGLMQSLFARIAIPVGVVLALGIGGTWYGAPDLVERNVVVGIIAALGGSILICLYALFHRRVTQPLSVAIALAEEIESGNLTQCVDSAALDEVGKLIRAMSAMRTRLVQAVGEVKSSAASARIGAAEIAQGNMSLSERTESQASSLEETASSMEEMTSTVRQNADNAREANQLALGAREQAEKGGAVVSSAVSAMGEISASSRKIADIIGVINEIAFQTNLLALNAAVEAARAGEQGRGFAVVASEVRNLASRSASAAKEIKDLIEDSVGKVDEGSRLVERSGQTLEGIVVAVKKVTDIVAEIAAASNEQSEGIEQVNRAVMELDEVTQQNAALVEEAASSSASMGEEARRLTELMAFFSIDGEPPSEFAGVADAAELAVSGPPGGGSAAERKDLGTTVGATPSCPRRPNASVYLARWATVSGAMTANGRSSEDGHLSRSPRSVNRIAGAARRCGGSRPQDRAHERDGR